MPDGTFRRPPQLWEQRIAGLVAVNSVGTLSGTGTSEVGSELTPGDGGPAPEPPTIAPTPTAFTTPSTPTVTGTVQGLRVTWDGNNSSGELYPPDAYVEIHVDTTSATFTPSASTLRGTLLRAGTFSVMGLTAGTTYYVRLVGKDGQGNSTAASTAASSQTGLTTSSDYGTATIDANAVSFNARQIGGITTTVGSTAPTSPVAGDIWLDSTGGVITHKRWSGSAWVTQAWGSDSLSANCITATQIAAGAVTAGAIAAGSITTAKLDASAVTADKIAAGAITTAKLDASAVTADKIAASSITTSKLDVDNVEVKKLASGAFSTRRVVIGEVGSTDAIKLLGASTSNGWLISHNAVGNDMTIGTTYSSGVLTIGSTATLDCLGPLSVETSTGGRAFRVNNSGEVFSYGIDDNTSGSAANVRIGASAQLLRSTSTARFKDNLAPLADGLAGVDADKVTDEEPSVNVYDVLTLTPTEFRSLSTADGGARMLGFIAEDVAAKFPWAANWDAEGLPSAVEDRPILAALLAVVCEQQQTIDDLTARVTALEGA